MQQSPWFFFRSGAVLVLLLTFTGCITIEENYIFKKDGSGAMEYVLDMSEMADLMNGFSSGKDDGMKRMEMGGDLDRLKALPGIRKVKLKKEKDGAIQRLSFRFADIAALNGALNTLMPDSSGRQHEFFRWEGSTLVRTTNQYPRTMTGDMGGETGDTTDVTAILKSMHYKYSFKFAQDIAETQVTDGMTTDRKSAREVKLSTDWSAIQKDPRVLDLRMVLDR